MIYKTKSNLFFKILIPFYCFVFMYNPSFSATFSGTRDYFIPAGKLIPASETDFIAQFNAGIILKEKAVVDLILGKLDKKSYKEVHDFTSKMNIDLTKDIKSIMFFGGKNMKNNSGVYIKGNFREELLKDYICEKASLKKIHIENYMEHNIYKKSDDFPGGYVFVEKDLIFAGPSDAMVQAIDLKVGWDNNNIKKNNKELYSLFKRADNEMIFWLALKVSDRLKKSSLSYHKKLKTIDELFLMITMEGGIKVNIDVGISDPKSINDLVSYFRQEISKVSDNEFFSKFLSRGQNIEVIKKVSGIMVSFYIPIDSLADIVKEIQKNFSVSALKDTLGKKDKEQKKQTYGF